MSEFEPSNFDKSQNEPRLHTERDMCKCPECTSALVYPTEWEEVTENSWLVSLRCPNCEWNETDEFRQDQCDKFDLDLDVGNDAISRDLRDVTAYNMREETERFVSALEADHILPEDF